MAVLPYNAPLKEMQLALAIAASKEQAVDSALAEAILEGAGLFARGVLSPLNYPADKAGGCRYDAATASVTTPAGWQDAYRQYCEQGWMGLGAPEAMGGQGLPKTLATLVAEMGHGANMAFGLCPMLSHSATDMLLAYGDEQQQRDYVPKLVSGQWTGTMCLTEPQAGSDLAAIRTMAEPVLNRLTEQGEARSGGAGGSPVYKITGSKIFITYGEHDLTENIIHTVLARLPDAPPGIKGLSLFIVPKFLLDNEGNLTTQRNDVSCVSIEHKLGIHGSPTCTMQFGQQDGAIGYLLGEKHKGIQAMFAMMNAARFAVGVEGIGVARYAYQLAASYAAERVQGRDASGQPLSINGMTDVKRMLLSLQGHDLTLRFLAIYVAGLMDAEKAASDTTEQQALKQRIALLTPIVKAHATDQGVLNCSTAMQVFGGMGYIEETGIAQLLRDIRITPIYEGTNGIQALDLAFRKLPLGADGKPGEAVKSLIGEIWQEMMGMQQSAASQSVKAAADTALKSLVHADKATAWMLQQLDQAQSENTQAAQLMAADYLRLMGLALQGWLALRALACTEHAPEYAEFRPALGFFIDYTLKETSGLYERVIHGELTRCWL